MNFMKTVQKVKEVKTEEVISGNDNDHTGYHKSDETSGSVPGG